MLVRRRAPVHLVTGSAGCREGRDHFTRKSSFNILVKKILIFYLCKQSRNQATYVFPVDTKVSTCMSIRLPTLIRLSTPIKYLPVQCTIFSTQLLVFHIASTLWVVSECVRFRELNYLFVLMKAV